MDIQFKNKVLDIYREVSHQTKSIQEIAESVVPDVNDDIGRIASIQSYLLLKSKDISQRGVFVSGEIHSSLLYITEDENAVSIVKLSKPFTIEFDVQDIDSDALSQINLKITGTEARIINPRKVSVALEITGELSCYRLESIETETELPELMSSGFHVELNTAESVVANAVCEKTFVINEQFSFPSGKPSPSQIIYHKIDFICGETQQIGTKMIFKGQVKIDLCYISPEVNYPVRVEFNTPFSQIIDSGCEKMDSCNVLVEMTSCYFNLTDTINGDKALDAEIHAVMQVVSRCKQKIHYISDAYSNHMPSKCCLESDKIYTVSDMLRAKLNADARVSVAEDCIDVLSVFADTTMPIVNNEKLSATAILDIIYRNKNGTLSSARRAIDLEGECLMHPTRILKHRLSDVYLRPDGAFIDAHISMELSYYNEDSKEIMRVCAVNLNEDDAYDTTKFASLTLVKLQDESLWKLAKKYHSSISGIEQVNNTETLTEGMLLLIPKEV